MKLLFVVNPVSGGVDKEPFLKEAIPLCQKFNIDPYIFKTTGKDDEKQLKTVLQTFQPDRVASVGGDGTVLFTSIALLNSSIPMGIIPLGSANGMAGELNVSSDPMEALKDIIMAKLTGKLDILRINDDHYCLHIGDVGINAQIVESYNKDENRGMMTYAKYFIEELNNVQFFEVEVEANGKIIKEEGVIAGICNFRKYGVGVPLNVEGSPMDGKFEIVIVKEINAGLLIKAGLAKFDEVFYDDQNLVIISTEKAKIRFNEPKLLQLDGEVIDEFKELKIDILPGAIKLIITNETSEMPEQRFKITEKI